jgi:large subunit ribosomal protein L2
MAIKKYRATSPGIRHRTDLGNEELTASRPHRALTTSLKKTGGRNNSGRVTRWHWRRRHRRYRTIDFRRQGRRRREGRQRHTT